MKRHAPIWLAVLAIGLFVFCLLHRSETQIYTLNDSGSFIKLAPGTTTVAPLKFQSGPLLSTITPGTMEYLNHTFYLTTYLIRRSVHLDQAIVTTPVTVSNTLTETVIYTIPMASNYITAGKIIRPRLWGIYWANNPQTFTLRLKYNGSTLLATTSTTSGATAKPWQADFTFTAVADGAGGSAQASTGLIQDTTHNMDALTAPIAFDTTTTNTIEITVQWSATGANSLQLNQGYTDCIQ